MSEKQILDTLLSIEKRLDSIEKQIKNMENSNNKLENHIDFVENIYDYVKTPFGKILNMVEGCSNMKSLPEPPST